MRWVALISILITSATCDKAAAVERIKIGSLGHSLGFLQLDVALAKGWLDSDDTTVEIVYFKSGKDCARALLSGEIPIAVLGVDHAITGQQEGVAIRQVALLNRLPGWTFVASSKISESLEIKDLKGMRIGVSSPGSATDVLTTYLLSKNGIGRDQFTVVKAGTSTLPDIMRNGGLDAAMALEPFGSIMLDAKEARLLVDFRSASDTSKHLGALYPVTSLLVRQDFIERSPNTVQHLTNSIVWACKWLHTATSDDVISALPSEFVPDSTEWRAAFASSREVFPPNGEIDVNGIHAVIAALVAYGSLSSADAVNVDQLYNNSFWENALTTSPPSAVGNMQKVDLVSPQHEQQRGSSLLMVVFGVAALILIALFLRPKRKA